MPEPLLLALRTHQTTHAHPLVIHHSSAHHVIHNPNENIRIRTYSRPMITATPFRVGV